MEREGGSPASSGTVVLPVPASHLLQLVEVECVLVAPLPFKPDEEQVHL